MRTHEEIAEAADDDIERQEEAAATIPDDATQWEIAVIVARRDEARKELALRGLSRLANEHTDREIRDAGDRLLERFGKERARCASCKYLLNWSDQPHPSGTYPGYYCAHADAWPVFRRGAASEECPACHGTRRKRYSPDPCPMCVAPRDVPEGQKSGVRWIRFIGRVWDIRPQWCPEWHEELRAAMAHDHHRADGYGPSKCERAGQRVLRYGLTALLLPAIAIAALLFCRSCGGSEEVSGSVERGARNGAGETPAVQAAYDLAIASMPAFAEYVKASLKLDLPEAASGRRYTVMLLTKAEVVARFRATMERVPPELEDAVGRCVAFCHHGDRTIYLSRADTGELWHELGHMWWPDDAMRTAYRSWLPAERVKLAPDETQAGERLAELFRGWLESRRVRQWPAEPK